jgi:hypothetical protein
MPIQAAAMASTTTNAAATANARFNVHQGGRSSTVTFDHAPISSLKEATLFPNSA